MACRLCLDGRLLWRNGRACARWRKSCRQVSGGGRRGGLLCPAGFRSCTNRRRRHLDGKFFACLCPKNLKYTKYSCVFGALTGGKISSPICPPRLLVQLLRTCIHNRMMQAGQGIFPPCKAKTGQTFGLSGFLFVCFLAGMVTPPQISPSPAAPQTSGGFGAQRRQSPRSSPCCF